MHAWSIHQLTEFFTALSASVSEAEAIAIATEQVSAKLEAEISAAFLDDECRSSWGVPSGMSLDGLRAVGAGPDESVHLGHLGDFPATSAPLGGDIDGRLVVARAEEGFTSEERHLLRAFAQVAGLTLRSLRAISAERHLREVSERQAAERLALLESLQERQRLVEALLAIQRSISHRHPLQEILDAITAGAAELLDGAPVVLALHDTRPGPSRLEVAADCLGDAPVSAGQMVAAVTDARAFSGTGVVLTEPVHVTGQSAGTLIALVPEAGHRIGDYSSRLAAFAQQVGLALTDARTVEQVHLARHDPLTGLPTRGLFVEALARRAAAVSPTSVLFIDLVRFKSINDTYGHLAGDELLAVVAGRIRSVLRQRDLIARLGGDEFAVLLPETSAADAAVVGARIIASVMAPIRLSAGMVSVGASIGAATAGADCSDPDEWLHRADMAMYEAKRRGSGAVVAFEAGALVEARAASEPGAAAG